MLNKISCFLLILLFPLYAKALIGMNGYASNLVSLAQFKDIAINHHEVNLAILPYGYFSPSAPAKLYQHSPIVRTKVILTLENLSNAHNHIMLGLPIIYADSAFSDEEKILNSLNPHLIIDGVKHKTKIVEAPKSTKLHVIKIMTWAIDCKPREKKHIELSYDMYISLWPIDLDEKNIDGVFGQGAIAGITGFFAYVKIDSGYQVLPGQVKINCDLQGVKKFLAIKNEINQGYTDARSFDAMMQQHFKQNYHEKILVFNSGIWKPWKFFDPFRYVYLNGFPKSSELKWQYAWHNDSNLNFGFEFEILDIPANYDECKLFYAYHKSKMTSSQFAHFKIELLKLYALDLNNQYHLNDVAQISKIVDYLKQI